MPCYSAGTHRAGTTEGMLVFDPNRSMADSAVSWKRITLLVLLAVALLVVIGAVYTVLQSS
jgi:hypothetical protein